MGGSQKRNGLLEKERESKPRSPGGEKTVENSDRGKRDRILKNNSISLSGSRKEATGPESTEKELAGGPIFEKFDFEPGSKAEKNGRKALRQLNKARFVVLARHPCERKVFTQEKGGKRALVEVPPRCSCYKTC